MLDIDLLQAATLLFAGVLAGFEVAVYYGLGVPFTPFRKRRRFGCVKPWCCDSEC